MLFSVLVRTSLLALALLKAPAAFAPTSPLYETRVTLAHAGEARLKLTAKAPGCDWGKAGAEAAVVTVMVDGVRNQEIVLFAGDTSHVYDVMLGPLPSGPHTISVNYRPDLSAKGASGATIAKAEVTIPNHSPEETLVWKYAPLLYGRNDNAASDVPLLLYYQLTDEPTRWHLVYSLIWSNEDGGTGNDLGSLVSRWGRSTDIEWIYDVMISKATGAVEKAVIQAAGHQTKPFAGSYRGSHPLLRTSTANNMVADTGMSPLLFAPAPLRAIRPGEETREAIMDAFPWSHEIAAKEMRREGKWETPGDPATIAASDIRNYLQVDYRAQCTNGALLAVQVRRKDGQNFFSDHGRRTDAIGRSGWIRTTVELPAGTKASDVAEVAFVRRDANANSTATIEAVHAFFLGDNYRPQKPFLRWPQRPDATYCSSGHSGNCATEMKK